MTKSALPCRLLVAWLQAGIASGVLPAKDEFSAWGLGVRNMGTKALHSTSDVGRCGVWRRFPKRRKGIIVGTHVCDPD